MDGQTLYEQFYDTNKEYGITEQIYGDLDEQHRAIWDDFASAISPAEVDPENLLELTIAGYAAYAKEANNLTWDLKPMPTWNELGNNIQRRWLEYARTIRDAIMKRYQGDHK